VYSPLQSISSTIGSLQEQFMNLQMAFELLDTEPDIRNAPDAKPVGRAAGRIAFDNVQFSYKKRVDTLKDVTFEAKEGQVVAIVGPTGAGKTTLASLLPRFYDATGGRILLDGCDIKGLTIESLREQISIVLQEPLLFSTTIAENIAYGRLDATAEEIVQAAKAANAHEFIMALPQQYDTTVGERGAQLSGGERQRIAVARAFLKNAPILILDEPTSSIDSKTEQVILDALERLMIGRTTLMIAHRLATVRHADQILVMNHGRIVQTGTHDELLRHDGLYRQLHEMQSGEMRRRVKAVVESQADAVGI
jgi:ABC-type multidrug transport system fused ATPase/permease subunit